MWSNFNAVRESLRHVTEPLLVFERSFDFVVTSTGIATLDKEAFERVFRDITTMQARVPVWTDHVIEALPLSNDSIAAIRQASGGARVAQRLRSLFEGGSLSGKKLTVDRLRGEMVSQGLDVDRLINGKKLEVSEADVPILLKLLDETLYKGWLTEVPWEAGSKSRRQ